MKNVRTGGKKTIFFYLVIMISASVYRYCSNTVGAIHSFQGFSANN
jgi:hypothetical protein